MSGGVINWAASPAPFDFLGQAEMVERLAEKVELVASRLDFFSPCRLRIAEEIDINVAGLSRVAGCDRVRAALAGEAENLLLAEIVAMTGRACRSFAAAVVAGSAEEALRLAQIAARALRGLADYLKMKGA